MFNSKRSLIEALASAKDIVNEANKVKADEKGYVTYLTSNGWVVGKEYPISSIDTSTRDKLAENLKKLQNEGKDIDAISIGVSMFNHWATHYEKENQKEIESTNAIFLEDVTIKTNDGKIINSNVFVLFSDQILGFLPAKLQLSSIV